MLHRKMVSGCLVKGGYTSPEFPATKGGSNGGLPVVAAMTQRPELFRVALPQLGVLGMLRYIHRKRGMGL